MINKILIASILMVPCTYADWIDDIMPLIDEGTLQQHRAERAAQCYVDTDENLVHRLEKMAHEETESGANAAIRAGTYKVQLASARVSLGYHKKVLAYIQGLARNERDCLGFVKRVELLNKYEHELTKLKASYDKGSGLGDSVKNGSLIGAKEVQIEALRTLIKSSLII